MHLQECQDSAGESDVFFWSIEKTNDVIQLTNGKFPIHGCMYYVYCEL